MPGPGPDGCGPGEARSQEKRRPPFLGSAGFIYGIDAGKVPVLPGDRGPTGGVGQDAFFQRPKGRVGEVGTFSP